MRVGLSGLPFVTESVHNFYGQTFAAKELSVSGLVTFASLLFAGDVALSASSRRDFQLSLGWLAAQCEAAGMRISTSNSETMVLSWKRVEFSLCVGSEVLPQVEEFMYLGVFPGSQVREEWSRKLTSGSM